jgi:hypothetical protein
MKNEKFDSLLNKMVEYSKSDKVVSYLFCYKGFLYKTGLNGSYYIKVIETIHGDKVPNDIIYLDNNDEQYIKFAPKPKLMVVSMKSWHYRLIKFILNDNAPTSKTMQNGCPYFWLLVLSILALPFVLLWKAVKFLVLLVPKILIWFLELMIRAWIKSLDDATAYEMYWKTYNGYAKMPATAKIFFKESNNDFYDYFLNEKYGLRGGINSEEYNAKKKEIQAKWDEWRKERIEKRQKEQEKEDAWRMEQRAKEARREARHIANKNAWDARMKPINSGFHNLSASISKVFRSLKPTTDWRVLIKRTKRIVGAIITLLVLAGTFVVVNFVAYGLIAWMDWSVKNWDVYVFIVCLAAVAGLMYLICVVFASWVQNIINKYERGTKIWYVEPLVWLWYVIKYLALGIFYLLLYIIWIPIKFIFYTFLWNIVFVNTGLFLWKVIKAFVKGLANSTGIFGEYFGASYSDYCPGIEWKDEEIE